MEHLELGGKRYMKVTSAARETGYTSDYIGQLCRAKKIDAKLVGRTWYVAQDEITNHKRTRGRSSYEKTRKAVRSAILESGETSIPVRIAPTQSYRGRITQGAVSYHADDAELLPTLTRTHISEAVHLHIKDTEAETRPQLRTNTAKHVAVDVQEEPVHFNKTAPTEVKWNGTIVVSALSEEAPVTSVQSRTPLQRHLKVEPINVRNNKLKLDTSDEPHDELHAQQHFLERMNLAHDLNKIHKVASKMKRIVDAKDSPVGTPKPDEVIALSKKEVLPQRAHSSNSAYFLIGTSLCVPAIVIGMLAASSFLSSEHQYRATAQKAGEVFSPHTTTIRVSSLTEARGTMSKAISNIRDIHISKLF